MGQNHVQIKQGYRKRFIIKQQIDSINKKNSKLTVLNMLSSYQVPFQHTNLELLR